MTGKEHARMLGLSYIPIPRSWKWYKEIPIGTTIIQPISENGKTIGYVVGREPINDNYFFVRSSVEKARSTISHYYRKKREKETETRLTLEEIRLLQS